MGCKESKHIANATDNTIITRTSSTKSTNRGQDDNDKNNVQMLQRSRSGRSTMQKQESLKKINAGDSKANNVTNKNEYPGDVKGTVDVNRELRKEGGKLKDINDQDVKGDKELIKENENVGVEAITKEKEGQNGNVGENGGKESILIPKEDLPSTSTKDGESNEAIKTDGASGASVYSTPTEVAGAFDNTKTNNAEEKKEPVEETEDPKTEEIAKENLTGNVDANPENHVREAEVYEKIKEAEAAVATPVNHVREAEVEEKIKEAEDAVESLENLIKEADKAEEILVTEANATAEDPVEETLEIPVNEVEVTNTSVRNPEKEANKFEEIRETEVEATDATPPNPVQVIDKSEENRGTETKAIDATLQNVGTEHETLIKAGEAVENGVKEIHEVTGKAEELPVKEVETSHETDQEALVADKAEVLEKEAEADYTTPKDPLKEAETADNVIENLVTVAEASTAGENPVNELESGAKVQSKDAANTEENTKSSSSANGRLSEENPDVKMDTDDFGKQ